MKSRIEAAQAHANALVSALSKLRSAPSGDPAACIALAESIALVLSPEAPAAPVVEPSAPVAELQADAVPAEVAIQPPGKAPKHKE